MKLQSVSPLLWIGCTSALTVQGFCAGYTSGWFSNPLPTKDPANPYYASGPQYWPELHPYIYWSVPQDASGAFYGYPFFPDRSQLGIFADPDAEYGGNFLTQASGEIITTPADQIPPSQVLEPWTWLDEAIGEEMLGGYDTALLKANSNSLEFTGRSVSYSAGAQVSLGALKYHNNVGIQGNALTDVTLGLEWSGNVPETSAWETYLLTLPIKIVSTPNVDGNPEASADFIYFPGNPEFGSLRVYEGETAEVPLLGTFGSLTFDGFGDTVTGGGFLSPSIAVPEVNASVATTLGLGGFGLFLAIRKRRR